jgi:hypothetical protein
MSNEDPGKNISWQNRLESMEHLPGSGFDKNASWNKLHGRLQGKRRKTPLWYWVAAACLFFALMIAWLMNDKTQPWISKTDVKAKKLDKVVTSVSPQENILVNDEAAVKINKVNPVHKTNRTVHRVTPTPTISRIDLNDALTGQLKNEPVEKRLEITNTALTVSLPVVQKKKLSVVHENELGGSTIESPDVARHISKRVIQFEIAKGEVITNSPVVSQNTDITKNKGIFKLN